MKILLALGADPSAARLAAALIGELRASLWMVDNDPEGRDAVQLVEAGGHDAALIGAALPEAPRLAGRLRAAAPDLALMALGAAPGLALKARLFDAGADDVLALPVEPAEVMMRARAIARRRHGHRERAIRFGDLAVIPGEGAEVRGRPLPLTRAEFALLEHMALRAGRSVTRAALFAALYGGPDEPDPLVINVRLSHLRRKLDAAGVPAGLIRTVWGVGWTIAAPHPPGAAMPPHGAAVRSDLRSASAAEVRA